MPVLLPRNQIPETRNPLPDSHLASEDCTTKVVAPIAGLESCLLGSPYNPPMGRFGPLEGLLLFAMQFAALGSVMLPRRIGWGTVALATLASFFAAFVAHILGFILLPDNAPMLMKRPVIALIWFATSALACLPFLRDRRPLLVQCGLACMLAYLLFAFAMDFLKPAPIV